MRSSPVSSSHTSLPSVRTCRSSIVSTLCTDCAKEGKETQRLNRAEARRRNHRRKILRLHQHRHLLKRKNRPFELETRYPLTQQALAPVTIIGRLPLVR